MGLTLIVDERTTAVKSCVAVGEVHDEVVDGSLSLVVPVGGSSDVSRTSIRPTTSSRVSAISRVRRPTSPVRARSMRGGVCRKHAGST